MGRAKKEQRGVVKQVVIETFCHSTEDCEKVRRALLNVVSPSLRNAIEIAEEVGAGYYGNEIRILRAQLKEAQEELSYLMASMRPEDKLLLRASLNLRVDEKAGRLYLRFDKQAAYNGRLELHDVDDVIKVVVTFRGLRRGELLEYLSSMLAKAPEEGGLRKP
ncbi:MAG: RNA-binding domain-containing protein [Desulfurococcaceae archaeon]